MKKYLGKGVYGAVAIGKISVFKKCDAAVTRIHLSLIHISEPTRPY